MTSWPGSPSRGSAHVAVFWTGVIRPDELAPANVSDVEMASEVLFGARGWALTDRNYWSLDLAEKLKGEGLSPLAPFKSKTHEKTPFPPNLTRLCRRIETIIDQLVGRFNAK